MIARSDEAPERFTLAFDLPAGATLQRAHTDSPIPGMAPQTIEIVNDDKTLAYVTAPIAHDADGQPVPATMSIEGQDIVLDVSHQDMDVRYPLSIDPEVHAYGGGTTSTWNGGWPGWHAATRPAHNPDASWGTAINNPAYYPDGLFLGIPKTQWSFDNNQAYFYFEAAAKTSITHTTFGGFAHSPLTTSGNTYAFEGMQNAGRTAWDRGTVKKINRNPQTQALLEPTTIPTAGGLAMLSSPSAYYGQEYDISDTAPPTGPAGPTEQNNAIFGILTKNNNNSGISYTGAGSAATFGAWVTMAWTQVYISDTYAPAWHPTTAVPTNVGWTDDTASPVHSRSFRATDEGLGLYQLKLTGAKVQPVPAAVGTVTDDTSTNGTITGGTITAKCTGIAPQPTCPTDWTSTQIGYTLNEGINTLTAQASDLAGGKTAPRSWTEKIDRTPPAITPSGTLYDARNATIGPDRDFSLSVTASDGSLSTPSTYRSGATVVTATLDGRPMTNSPVTAACTRPEGSCGLSLATTLTAEETDELDAGVHLVRMTATDAAGKTTPVQSFSFTFDPEQSAELGAEQPTAGDLGYSGSPSCSALPPVAPTVIDAVGSVVQTLQQAIQSVAAVLPAAVNSSIAATTAQLAPKLALDGDQAMSSGSLTELRIGKQLEHGFALGAGDGGVCFSPTRISDEARPGALASDGAMVFANSDRATTTVLRPTATGAESLTVLNDPSAPRSFSWRVNAGEGRRLVTLDDGSVAIVNPFPTPPEDEQFAKDVQTSLVNAGLDQLEPNTPVSSGAQALAAAVGDTPAELANAHDGFARAQNSRIDEIVLVIPKPWALDAAGQSVPTSLSTDGNTITMTVDPAPEAQYPIVADPTYIATAARRGSPLRLMTFNTRGGSPADASDAEKAAYHASHPGRIAAVIANQVGSKARDHRVPAIVGLQEMCRSHLPAIVAELNRRDAGTSTHWRSDFQRLRSTGRCPRNGNRDGDFGNAIVRNVDRLAGDMRRFNRQDRRYNQDTGKRAEQRGYIRARLNVRGRPVEFLTTHLLVDQDVTAPDSNTPIQQQQSQQLLTRIKNLASSPRAATGDFNSRPDSEVVKIWLRALYRDVDRCTGDHHYPQCQENTTINNVRIDYIFTRGMKSNGANVAGVNDETSDHDTLVASTYLP